MSDNNRSSLSLFENENPEKTMTTKELADVLGVTERTIRRVANEIFEPRTLMSRVINGGISYVFTPAQATAIKIELQNHTKVAKNGFNSLAITNDLDMMLMQQKLTEYQNKRIEELTNQVQEMVPNYNFGTKLLDASGLMTVAQAAKSARLSFGSRTLYEKLVNDGYLMESHEPYQRFVNSGYFVYTESSYNNGYKDIVCHTTKVTQKGLKMIMEKYGNNN